MDLDICTHHKTDLGHILSDTLLLFKIHSNEDQNMYRPQNIDILLILLRHASVTIANCNQL